MCVLVFIYLDCDWGLNINSVWLILLSIQKLWIFKYLPVFVTWIVAFRLRFNYLLAKTSVLGEIVKLSG